MQTRQKTVRNILLLLGILGCAVALSSVLSTVNNDNNPFATSVFILAVVLIARTTDGYLYGIAASLIGTFCVNYMFTYPFWSFDMSFTGYPLTFVTMLLVSIVVSALTTQIKAQEKLRYEAEREKMHANLLRAIAHDLRTPLSSILGASSALRERQVSEEDQIVLLDAIHRDAQWLIRVTENLLSVTRVSGSAVSLKKEDEVLEEIVGSAIVKYRRNTDALPVEVIQPDRLLIVPMDAMLIEQVLINLFDNVSAHAENATKIWLRISCTAAEVTVSVEDDGIGIPESLLPTVFDGQLHQSDSRATSPQRGMGIGLSVCRSIVKAHGGDMRAQRSQYGGACVSFILPYTEADNEPSDSQ